MKKVVYKKKKWQMPEFKSLKFSQTYSGTKADEFESTYWTSVHPS